MGLKESKIGEKQIEESGQLIYLDQIYQFE